MSTFTLDTATSRATPSPVPGKRMTAPSIRARKVDGKTAEPLVMLTAYTMRMAQLLDPHCDMLLVGDSLGQVIYGLPSTIPVTLDMMCAHGAAVVRGSWHALVAVDMPFGSYEASPEVAFASASRVMKETGCAAVKLEGGEAMAPTVRFLTERGIPVIGHVGLTPQAVNILGGYGARGKNQAEAAKIVADASAIAQAGAFSIVVEGVLEDIATKVSKSVEPPVIGIGASAECDGQVLVIDDMLGMFERTPRFVKRYDDLAARIDAAAKTYAEEVRARTFPTAEQTYRPKVV
jgi:3-methyl-2-oxobutanoate hydroxymethyltransferase